MRLFLMAGSLATAALIAACEKSNEENHSVPLQPLQPNRNFRTTFTLTNPRQEYQNLCRILFNREGLACESIRPSVALQETPSSTSGLNAYTRGIINRTPGYDYETANTRWSTQLQALEGARYYLSGHGGCTLANKDEANRPCYKINDGSSIPAVYDFVDDYSNLIGAFFFLKSQQALFRPNVTCALGVATLGSDDAPFCAMYTMHNIVLTPVALNIRGAHANLAQASCGGVR